MSSGLMTQADHARSASYRMPAVFVGQTVWWHIDGNKVSPPFAAFVTAVNPRAVKLAVWEPESAFARVLDCVRHVNDPSIKDLDILENGAWQHMPYPLPTSNEQTPTSTPEMENLKAVYEGRSAKKQPS